MEWVMLMPKISDCENHSAHRTMTLSNLREGLITIYVVDDSLPGESDIPFVHSSPKSG